MSPKLGSRPTSVLAGILRLSLLECEIGTLQGPEKQENALKFVVQMDDVCGSRYEQLLLVSCRPIIFFVGACSLSGSFYLKQEESEAGLSQSSRAWT